MTGGAQRARTLLVAGIGIGLVLRLAAVWLAPRFGYLPDHLDSMAWSTWVANHGVRTIYDMQPELVPLRTVAADAHTQHPATYLVLAPHAYNYPPLSAYVFLLKGTLWHALDRDVQTLPVPSALRPWFERYGLPPTMELRTVNTRLARAIDAAPSFAFDMALALGVMALVRVLGCGPAAGAVAFALVLASPVVVLDAALWGQSDSWIASMLVWCLVWWLRGRHVAAGAAYGLALVTKPQAILFAPVLAFAVLALRHGRGGSWARVAAALRAVPAAVFVLALAAAPFMAHDARSGARAWRWVERSYVGTIGADEYAYTTLNAFNLWWLDFAAARPSGPDWFPLLDSRAPVVFGLSKDAVGAGLLALSIVLAGVLCTRRLGWNGAACTVFAFAVLLSAFLLPTRVHERYVYYCVPFVTALAVHRRPWRLPWAALSLVGTAEMLSHLWVAPTARALALSSAAALLAVALLPWAYALVWLGRRESGCGAEGEIGAPAGRSTPAASSGVDSSRSR